MLTGEDARDIRVLWRQGLSSHEIAHLSFSDPRRSREQPASRTEDRKFVSVQVSPKRCKRKCPKGGTMDAECKTNCSYAYQDCKKAC